MRRKQAVEADPKIIQTLMSAGQSFKITIINILKKTENLDKMDENMNNFN